MSIFGDIERLVADLYPYRWPITIGLVLAATGFVALAWRQGWHLVVWRHRIASSLAIVVFLAAAIPLGNYLLSPLWERSLLEEASPLAEAAAGVTPTPTAGGGKQPTPAPTAGASAQPTAVPTPGLPPAFEPRVTASGTLAGADSFHFGNGTALVIETAPDTYTLRFVDFSVRNGPDLFVYLTADANNLENAINLGELKATDGAFNYEVPAGTDVSRFTHAIVWCRQFEVLFASAPLAPA